MNPIQTLREALDAMSGGKYPETMKVALAALAELEKQEPVHWRAILDPAQAPHQWKTSMHVVGFREKQAAEGFVAEQSDFYNWRYTIEPLYAAPVAQQPQADEPYDEIEAVLRGAHAIMETVAGLERRVGPVGSHARGYTHKITMALGRLRRVREACAQQPQAEAVPGGRIFDEKTERADANAMYEKRVPRVSERNEHERTMYCLGWWDRAWTAAPQQAEAVPPTHVPVPVELLSRVLVTPKMRQAWVNAVAEVDEHPIDAGFRAMLAAAPKGQP